MFDKDMASDGVGSIVLAWKLVVSCSFKPHVTIPSDLHWISRWADGRWVVRSFWWSGITRLKRCGWRRPSSTVTWLAHQPLSQWCEKSTGYHCMIARKIIECWGEDVRDLVQLTVRKMVPWKGSKVWHVLTRPCFTQVSSFRCPRVWNEGDLVEQSIKSITWSHPRQGPGPEKSENEFWVATWHDHDPAGAFGAKDNYLVVSTLQLGFCMTLYVEGRPKPVRLSAPSRHSQPFFEGRCSIAFILNGLHAKHVQLQSCFFMFFSRFRTLPGYWFAALVDASLCDVQRRRLSAPCCTKSPTAVDLLSIRIPKPLQVIQGPTSEGYPDLLHFLLQVRGNGHWRSPAHKNLIRDNSASWLAVLQDIHPSMAIAYSLRPISGTQWAGVLPWGITCWAFGYQCTHQWQLTPLECVPALAFLAILALLAILAFVAILALPLERVLPVCLDLQVYSHRWCVCLSPMMPRWTRAASKRSNMKGTRHLGAWGLEEKTLWREACPEKVTSPYRVSSRL